MEIWCGGIFYFFYLVLFLLLWFRSHPSPGLFAPWSFWLFIKGRTKGESRVTRVNPDPSIARFTLQGTYWIAVVITTRNLKHLELYPCGFLPGSAEGGERLSSWKEQLGLPRFSTIPPIYIDWIDYDQTWVYDLILFYFFKGVGVRNVNWPACAKGG